MYKISYKDILYNMGKVQILCNNYKWNINFKNCDSLHCTLVTYNIVHQIYFNFKKKSCKEEHKITAGNIWADMKQEKVGDAWSNEAGNLPHFILSK